MKLLPLLIAFCLPAQAVVVWEAHPVGGGSATAVATTWGGLVDYRFSDAVTVSISAVTSYHVTTRTVRTPLTMSWSSTENIPWYDAFENQWVEFSVYGSDGIVRSAPFYNQDGHTGPRKASMFSSASSVPEPSTYALISGLLLAAFGIKRRLT